MSTSIRYVTEAELRSRIDAILARYPWFETYPISCHSSCARWEIADEHGADAGDAWQEFETARWLLQAPQTTAAAAGAEPDDKETP